MKDGERSSGTRRSDQMIQLMHTIDGWQPIEVEAKPELPEFQFSAHKGERATPVENVNPFLVEPVWQGPMVPPIISNPRRLHVARPVDDREKAWANVESISAKHAPIKQQGFVAPLGALEGMDHFLARVEALQRIADQQARDEATNRVLVEQDKEMATIIEEFVANGFHAVSLSSSQNDDDGDDLEAANIAETHLGIVPYAFGIKGYAIVKTKEGEIVYEDEDKTIPMKYALYNSAEEAAPILRRIDHEKIEAKHGPAFAVILTDRDANGIPLPTIATMPKTAWMQSKMGNGRAKAMGRRLLERVQFESPEELVNARLRVEFYGKIGSCLYGVTKGYSYPEQSMDILGIEDMEKPETSGGESELTLHTLSSDYPEEYGQETVVLDAPSVAEMNSWYEEAI